MTQPTICFKCKHCIKTRYRKVGILKVRCRVPDDPTEMDYITGEVRGLTYGCSERNPYGTCIHYKENPAGIPTKGEAC